MSGILRLDVVGSRRRLGGIARSRGGRLLGHVLTVLRRGDELAKVSARGDRELRRVVFADGAAYILTERGRVLFRNPVDGRLRLMATREQVRDPRDYFKRLVATRARYVAITERV